MFITVFLYYLDPSIIIILPLKILCPCAPSFALRIFIFCIPTQFCRKHVVSFECHLKLTAYGFEMASFVFLVPHAFVRVNAMGLLALRFLAMGVGVFAGASLSSFFFFLFFLPRDLDCLSFLRPRLRGLRSSSSNSLVEVVPYTDLVYSKLESSPSIIE